MKKNIKSLVLFLPIFISLVIFSGSVIVPEASAVCFKDYCPDHGTIGKSGGSGFKGSSSGKGSASQSKSAEGFKDPNPTLNSSGEKMKSNWPSSDNAAAAARRITQEQYNKAVAIITDPTKFAELVTKYGSMTHAQVEAALAAASPEEKIIIQAARAASAGGGNRQVTIGNKTITVESCSNGFGGQWTIVNPPAVNYTCTDLSCNPNTPTSSNNPATCQFLLANGRAGTVTIPGPGLVNLSWQTSGSGNTISISPTPGSVSGNTGSRGVTVNDNTTFKLDVSNAYGSDSCAVQVNVGSGPTKCTDSGATNYLAEAACTYTGGGGNPTVSAVIEAMVDINGGGVYSGLDRYVAAGYPIYLRWKGVQSNGKAANYCAGVTPNDFTAPAHTAIGSFENGDGQVIPYPGLANGESKTFSVRCYNDFGSALDSVTLTGATDFANLPPTITANGISKVLVVPYGTDVNVAWNPQGNPSCTLSSNLSGSDPTNQGSKTIKATGESTYTINCGAIGSASVRVMVLPVLEET